MAAHLGIAIKTLEDGKKELSGKTFDHREQIKAAGGRWDPDRKVWTLPAEAKLDFLPAAQTAPLKAAPQTAPLRPLAREEWSREHWQNYCLRQRGNCGPCCKHATAYESRPYGPICYRCPRHGETINNWCGD
jgi:hypothetical protein